MNRFKAITAASVMLLATAGAGNAAISLGELSLSEQTGPFGDYLYTVKAFDAFTSTLQGLLTSSSAFNEIATLIGQGTLLMGGSTADSTYWSSAISFNTTTLTVSMVGYNFSVASAPIDTSITVPGPVAAAGLPAVLGLIGFAAWRRRRGDMAAAA